MLFVTINSLGNAIYAYLFVLMFVVVCLNYCLYLYSFPIFPLRQFRIHCNHATKYDVMHFLLIVLQCANEVWEFCDSITSYTINSLKCVCVFEIIIVSSFLIPILTIILESLPIVEY